MYCQMDYIRYLIWAISLVYSCRLVPAFPMEVIRDDMVFTLDQYKFLKSGVRSRNMLFSPDKYWPNNTIIYRYGEGLNSTDIEKITNAMKAISDQTCIEFQESSYPSEPSLVIQRIEEACWAVVGFQNRDVQELNLGTLCMDTGRILHELIHVLGFLHMQCDPNRDDFIEIKFENILPGSESNFDIFYNSGDFGVGYDYDSIMHYGPKHFTKNNENTIVPKQEGVTIGQRIGMSPKDILKINLAYCQNDNLKL